MCLTLAFATALFGVWFIDFSVPAFEDAAMLMRYAQHVAGGHGIVWNVGEAPVDGATDFLFMMMAAAVTWLGLTVEQGVRVLGWSAHLLTVLVVYVVLRRQRAGKAVAALCASYLAIGPGLYYVAAYFGTPVFGLFAALTWAAGQWVL